MRESTGSDDLNLVMLTGRIASPIEVRSFDSGARLVRILITVRSEKPKRRVDVIPVTYWDDEKQGFQAFLDSNPQPGDKVWAVGSTQRRFWNSEHLGSRTSRLEIVAEVIETRISHQIAATP